MISNDIIITGLISALVGAIIGSTIGSYLSYLFNRTSECERNYQKTIVQLNLFSNSLSSYLANRTGKYFNEYYFSYTNLKSTILILDKQNYKKKKLLKISNFINDNFMEIWKLHATNEIIEDIHKYMLNFSNEYNELLKKL